MFTQINRIQSSRRQRENRTYVKWSSYWEVERYYPIRKKEQYSWYLTGTYLFNSTYINQSGCDLICSLTAETYFTLSLEYHIISYHIQIISNQMIGKG